MAPELDESAYFVVGETAHPHGTHIAVVEVDAQLGVVKVLKYLIAYDIGLAINPMLVEGQLIGGFAQGLGGALLEELVYSPEAQLLTGSFMDYLLPTSMEMPAQIDVLLLQDVSRQTIRWAPRAPVKPVRRRGSRNCNAIEDALSPLGIVVNALPLSPSAIFDLIQARSNDHREPLITTET